MPRLLWREGGRCHGHGCLRRCCRDRWRLRRRCLCGGGSSVSGSPHGPPDIPANGPHRLPAGRGRAPSCPSLLGGHALLLCHGGLHGHHLHSCTGSALGPSTREAREQTRQRSLFAALLQQRGTSDAGWLGDGRVRRHCCNVLGHLHEAAHMQLHKLACCRMAALGAALHGRCVDGVLLGCGGHRSVLQPFKGEPHAFLEHRRGAL
mmetsp:Transcript_76370/g.196674  ORF Transcript_76370/g.196674 Transcript_76370/m.196674 type:complete len:206 (+) Transcript_76370:486-1103(+)